MINIMVAGYANLQVQAVAEAENQRSDADDIELNPNNGFADEVLSERYMKMKLVQDQVCKLLMQS